MGTDNSVYGERIPITLNDMKYSARSAKLWVITDYYRVRGGSAELKDTWCRSTLSTDHS